MGKPANTSGTTMPPSTGTGQRTSGGASGLPSSGGMGFASFNQPPSGGTLLGASAGASNLSTPNPAQSMMQMMQQPSP